MATMAIAFPVVPGKAEEGRRLASELLGPRRAELDALFRRLGVTREAWYLQPTPMGELVIVYIEGDDPAGALREWAASNDPFDRWFKQQAGAVSGIDFSQPPPAFPEQIFEWPGR